MSRNENAKSIDKLIGNALDGALDRIIGAKEFDKGFITTMLEEFLTDEKEIIEILEGSIEYTLFYFSKNEQFYNELHQEFHKIYGWDEQAIDAILKSYEKEIQPFLLHTTLPHLKPRYQCVKALFDYTKEEEIYEDTEKLAPIVTLIKNNYGFLYRYVKNRSVLNLSKFKQDVLLNSPKRLTFEENRAYVAMFFCLTAYLDKEFNLGDSDDKVLGAILSELKTAIRLVNVNIEDIIYTETYKKKVRPIIIELFKDITGLSFKDMQNKHYSVVDVLFAIQKHDTIVLAKDPLELMPYLSDLNILNSIKPEATASSNEITGISEIFFESGFLLLLENFNYKTISTPNVFSEIDWFNLILTSLLSHTDNREFCRKLITNLFTMLLSKELKGINAATPSVMPFKPSTDDISADVPKYTDEYVESLKNDIKALNDITTSKDNEMANLKLRIKEMEQEHLAVARDYIDEISELTTELQKKSEEAHLVPSLLNTLYADANISENLTSLDEDALTKFQTLIKDKKVVLAGGHPNFLSKIHLTFPEIYTIAPRDYVGEHQARNADIIIYIAMMQNHGQFLRLSPHFHAGQKIIFVNDITSLKRLAAHVLSEYNRLDNTTND